MFQNKYKSSGKDAKKNETQRDKTPKKDVELCLEVEMDDEVREIITSPEKCLSTLLDVTVIKPKDLDHLYCSQKATLSCEEVRKLITSMELEKQDKQKLIDKLLTADDGHISVYRQGVDPKSSGDYVKKKFVKKISGSTKGKQNHYKKDHDPASFIEQLQRISTSDDTNSDHITHYKQKPRKKADDHVQQIYTTPKTYNDIKSIFTCKNKNNYDQNEKPDKPCLCRNCAIVGVLTDSQKKPFITENLYDPRDILSDIKKEAKDFKDYKRKKGVNFKDDDHAECEYYFKHLSAKIRRLEDRLSIQEEKSVPKEYFKRIITKLVTHLGKITNYSSYDSPNSRNKDQYRMKGKYGESRYFVNPLLVDQVFDGQAEKDIPTTSNLSNDKDPQQEGFWKWGEEILRPGIDLKNKIVMLLEDTLHNLRKPKDVPSKLEATGKIFDSSFEAPQKIPADVPVRDMPNKKVDFPCKHGFGANNCNSGSTLLKTKKSNEKKWRRHAKQDSLYEESLNVSYLNPEMSKWHEESQFSFKLDSSDMDSLKVAEERKLNESYKCEFRETLATTKESDKLRLWHSIWAQAKINGHTKEDKVTIQIPERKNMKSDKTVEIEYTIAELEDLLLGSRHASLKHGSRRNDRK